MQKHNDIQNQSTHANECMQKRSAPFFNPVIQAKLAVNAPGDIYEQEADAVADKIMRTGSSVYTPTFFSPVNIQRKCTACEEEEKNVQRKKNGHEAATSLSQTENYVSSVSGGKALGNKEKSFFESRMGYDFSNVRIHDDSSANQSAKHINALAYTSGNNIVFDQDRYQPDSDEGKKLLAHELTHVMQQQNVQTIQRQANPDDANTGTTPNTKTDYYIGLILRGAFSAPYDVFGMTQRGVQDITASDMIHDEGICLDGTSLAADISFCHGAPGTAATPPITALAIEYKEPGHFTSLKFTKRDENPVPDITAQRTCWQPDFPTHFKFDVFKKGTLKITAELFGTDNNELSIYSDVIEIEKCAGSKKCTGDAVATNRWLVIPDNGGPMHPLGPSDPDDGEHYEIYAETGTGNYFICKGESMSDRLYVDRRGYAL